MNNQLNVPTDSFVSFFSEKPVHPPLRLSKSLDSPKESSHWNEIFVKDFASTTPGYFTRSERSRSISDKLSPRSFEKRIEPKLHKSGSKKQVNKRIFNSLENLDFSLTSAEKIRSALNITCIKAFDKITTDIQNDLCEWLFQQAENLRNDLAKKPHLWAPFESNLKMLKAALDNQTREETTKKLETLKESLKGIIEAKIGSIGDFAALFKNTVNQFPEKYQKDFCLLFYKTIAENEKQAVDVLNYLVKWSRDPRGLEELAIAFYNNYLARKTFQVFEGSLQQVNAMKISLLDVRRHLIIDHILQIKKIVVNETPINDLDLLENNQLRNLKKDQDFVFYSRMIAAILKRDPTNKEITNLMTAEQFSEIKNQDILKIALLMRSGTVNFWKLSHDKLLGMLNETDQVRISPERGTTWSISVENSRSLSLNQIKNYLFFTNESNKVLSIHLQCLTHFDFKQDRVKSTLTISAVTPKVDMSEEEHLIVMKLLGFTSKV